MSGLMAACILAEAGLSVLVVEAGDRVGGRMHSQCLPGLRDAIELGAEFVHGRPEDLLALIQDAGLHLEEVDGRDYCVEDSRLSACTDRQAFQVLGEMEEYCDQHPEIDMSFADYLKQTDLPESSKQSASRFVEGFNAADAATIGIQALSLQQKAEDAIEGDRVFRIREGYTALAEHLKRRLQTAGGRLAFSTPIHQVIWQPGQVRFGTTNIDGSSVPLAAHQAVLALPLGVLQANRIEFSPRPQLLEDLNALSMGPVLRVTFLFSDRFWDTPQHPYGDLSFLFAEHTKPGVFWTRSPSNQPSITAWAGGSQTTRFNLESFARRALETLASAFDLSQSELNSRLVSTHSHPWNTDVCSFGAYSFVRAGGLPVSRQLCVPIEDTLFFAGEHTDTTGHWGTVHGAMRSGVRAASQILAGEKSRV